MAITDSTPLPARLTIFVAFDWGDEVDLAHASQLVPGIAVDLDLVRRSRTPSSIAYKPAPLRFNLAVEGLLLPELQGIQIDQAEATIFDFGGVSVSMRVALNRSLAELSMLAGKLADAAISLAVVRAAQKILKPLHEKLLPAILKPQWTADLWEEYYVFQFSAAGPLTPDDLLEPLAGQLAGLVRLEDQPLSASEVAEATRLRLRYGPDDLFVADWPAAALLDQEDGCEETLRTIEFANLQLLEYRHIDDRLDGSLTRTYKLAQRAAHAHFPFLGGQDKPLRAIAEWKVEATGLFERTGNVLKLIGDQYLARVYRQLALRFHLRDWEKSIRRKLEVIEGVYKAVSDQRNTFRMEFLEVVVVLLIALEILLALFKH